MAKLEGTQKIKRYKIGTGSMSSLKVKQTGPGVMVVDIGTAKPSRPQNRVRMSVGGTKARIRHKGRVDPKAASARDPGPTPMPSTKVHWPTTDRNMQKGYMVGKGWPASGKNSGPNPYRTINEGGYGADGVNMQDSEGSYSDTGQAAAE